MAAISEFLLNILSGAIESVGESKLVEVLQKLHDNAPDEYRAAIFGGHALASRLKPLVAKSGTKIDDALVDALHDAIHTSAAANGVVLEDK